MARMRIKDIAEQAGVSPATVSRYLNHRPGQMTEETRARIAEVIERTGYRPRAAARNLRLDNTKMLGVILADGSNPYSSAMLEGLSVRAAARGYSLMTSISGNDPEREKAAISRLVEMGVEGLIVNTCGGCDGAIEKVASGLPVVLLDRDTASSQLDFVTSNNAELMQGLVEEIARTGCRRVVLLTQSGAPSSVRRERAAAFEAHTRKLGLGASTLELSEDAVPAVTALREIYERVAASPETLVGHGEATGKGGPARLGLIAMNGLVFLRFVEAMGKVDTALASELPACVALATFDDYVWNHAIYGGVTTAAQDTDAIVEAVLTRLVERVESGKTFREDRGKTVPLRMQVPGGVSVRTTTAKFERRAI